MRGRTIGSRRQQTPNDVGTLWTMQRRERLARCALIDYLGGWEVRVLVDGEIRLAECCDAADEAFALAEGWKLRLIDQGWTQIVPQSVHRQSPRRKPSIAKHMSKHM
jgi:hypothetical protein